jgi:hypothetical protein
MAMSTNVELFKAIVERGFSQGDFTFADEVCDAKLIEQKYLTRTDLPGPQILKTQIEDASRSIKDLKFLSKLLLKAAIRSGCAARHRASIRAQANQLASTSWTSVDLPMESLSNIGGYQTGLRSFISLGRYHRRPTERNLGYAHRSVVGQTRTSAGWCGISVTPETDIRPNRD